MSSVLLLLQLEVVPHPVPASSSTPRHSVLLLAWLTVTVISLTVTGVRGQPVECHRPPLDVHPKDCCRMPQLLDDSLLTTCKQIHGGEDLKRVHERGNCFMECAMNATGTLINGKLDLERILQLVASSNIGSAALKSVMSGACIKCFQARQQRLQQQSTSVGGGGGSGTGKICNSGAAQFLSCVNTETFKACLPEYWTESSNCITLRKFIESCPIP